MRVIALQMTYSKGCRFEPTPFTHIMSCHNWAKHLPPHKYGLGREDKTKVDSIHHTQGKSKVPACRYRACDVE